MSDDNWEVGDFAAVLCSDGNWRPAMCRHDVTMLGTRILVWLFPDGARRRVDESQARALVLIDADDDSAIHRLTAGYWNARQGIPTDAWVPKSEKRYMAYAVRALLRAPKPDEPTLVGAVVEDSEGRLWTRIDATDVAYADSDEREQFRPPWRRGGENAKWWDQLTAVRVVSEGVTP